LLELLASECALAGRHGSNFCGFRLPAPLRDEFSVDTQSFFGGCAERFQNWMRSDQGIFRAQAIAAKGAPVKSAWIWRDEGANGIQFNVAIATKQVGVTVDEARLVSSFPERASSVHREIEVRNVAASQLLHQASNAAFLDRRGQEVYVIAHEDVGVHVATEPFGLLAQVSKELSIMDFQNEARASVDAALDDVLGQTWKVESVRPSHGPTIGVGSKALCRDSTQT